MYNADSLRPEKLLDNLIGVSRKITDNSDDSNITSYRYEFCELFNELYRKSTEMNWHWLFCCFSVYESNFKNLMTDYLSKYPDANEKYFIELEIENLNNSFRNGVLHFYFGIRLSWDFTGSQYGKGVNTINRDLPLDFLDYEIKNKVINSQKRKLDFLKLEKENSKNELQSNPHSRIFKRGAHFKLFEYLKESVKNELADYSFIFRAMQKDKFIYEGIKEKEFRSWLNDTYGISIGKLKLHDYCKTQSKVSNYGTSKLLYNL